MALVSTDERELLLPLTDGVRDGSAWRIFIARLAARTGADRATLIVSRADRPEHALVETHGGARGLSPVDMARLAAAGLVRIGDLRPGRVYALDEFVESAPGERRKAQRAVLVEANLRDARFVRTPPRDGLLLTLALFCARRDFRAADSALLSALVPHLAAALGSFAMIDELRRQAALARNTLAALCVATLVFDADARLLAADPQAAAILGEAPVAGRRLSLPPDAARAVEQACATFAVEPSAPDRLVPPGSAGGPAMLLRPAVGGGPALALPAVATAYIRHASPISSGDAARVLAAQYGLSANEAALAEALARGETIVEAGAHLRLTSETARNYSKRIYAKTGARGQADLVRMVLTGLAPLA